MIHLTLRSYFRYKVPFPQKAFAYSNGRPSKLNHKTWKFNYQLQCVCVHSKHHFTIKPDFIIMKMLFSSQNIGSHPFSRL